MVDSVITVLTAVGGLLNLFAFTIALHCIISILSFEKTRMSSFNVYVVAVLIPDVLVNFCNAITAAFLVHERVVYFLDLCVQRNVIILFNFFSNLYLNGVVARETYVMMNNSFKRKKTSGPTVRKAVLQTAIVYILSFAYSLWAALEVPSSPFHIANIADCQFLPGSPELDTMDGGWFSSIGAGILHACVFMPPLIYVLYACIVVKKRHLMPIQGRTRAVALYFFRIAVVFFCFYFPIFLLGIVNFFFVEESTDGRQSRLVAFWLPWSVTQLMLVQLLVTVRMVLEKDDIREAVFQNNSFCILRGISALTKATYYNPCCGKTTKKDAKPSNGETNPHEQQQQQPHHHSSSKEGIAMNSTEAIVSEWAQSDVYERIDDHATSDIEADVGQEDDSADTGRSGKGLRLDDNYGQKSNAQRIQMDGSISRL